MDCWTPLFDADASFSFLDEDELHTQLPPINELFSTLDNYPMNAAEMFPCLASL